MPELPEVEYARRHLEEWLGSHAVVAAHAAPTRIFRGADKKAFEALRGKATRVERRGKLLLIVFSNGAVRSHLGMSGKWVRRDDEDEKHSRAYFTLDDGTFVHYRDPRMFGRIEPTEETHLDPRELGVDALGIDAAALRKALEGARQPIKVALMDQSRIAGLGNIQASEALYRAKISPFRSTAKVTEWAALARGINASLSHTLRAQARREIVYVEEDASANPFWVYGRKGEPCRVCRGRIAAKTQAGRTTYYCPRCQKR